MSAAASRAATTRRAGATRLVRAARRGAALARAGAPLGAADPASSAAGELGEPISEAEQLLFLHPHLASMRQPRTLPTPTSPKPRGKPPASPTAPRWP